MTVIGHFSAETFGFSDAIENGLDGIHDEGFQFRDWVVSTQHSIMGDLAIYDEYFNPNEAEDFMLNRPPVGYTYFADFDAGTIKFQYAFVNFVFEPKNSIDATLSLTGAVIYADLPDKVESNTATVTVAATGVSVTFTKTFHVAPDVVITPIGSSAISVALTAAPSTTGFTAKMYDSAGTAITGTFIWTAVGY